MNFVKINFHGDLFGESDEAGLGVVIRNSEGEVMVAPSEKIMKPSTVETLELLAARCAVAFFLEVGSQNSNFKGDSVSIINSLKDRDMSNSHGVHIIKGIVSYANSF